MLCSPHSEFGRQRIATVVGVAIVSVCVWGCSEREESQRTAPNNVSITSPASSDRDKDLKMLERRRDELRGRLDFHLPTLRNQLAKQAEQIKEDLKTAASSQKPMLERELREIAASELTAERQEGGVRSLLGRVESVLRQLKRAQQVEGVWDGLDGNLEQEIGRIEQRAASDASVVIDATIGVGPTEDLVIEERVREIAGRDKAPAFKVKPLPVSRVKVERKPPDPADAVRVKQVNPLIENALEVAYGRRVSGTEAPAAAIQFLVQPGGRPAEEWRSIGNGDRLSSGDNYRVFFRPAKTSFVYVFQIDSRGKLDWLYPGNKSPFSSGSNPTRAGLWTQLPPGKDSFYLDESVGIEHVYVVVTSERWSQLERSLSVAAASGRSQDQITKPFNLRLRGVGGVRQSVASPVLADQSDGVVEVLKGRSGVLVNELWFRHVGLTGR